MASLNNRLDQGLKVRILFSVKEQNFHLEMSDHESTSPSASMSTSTSTSDDVFDVRQKFFHHPTSANFSIDSLLKSEASTASASASASATLRTPPNILSTFQAFSQLHPGITILLHSHSPKTKEPLKASVGALLVDTYVIKLFIN